MRQPVRPPRFVEYTPPIMVEIADTIDETTHDKYAQRLSKFKGLTSIEGKTYLILKEELDEADELEIMSILEVPVEDYK